MKVEIELDNNFLVDMVVEAVEATSQFEEGEYEVGRFPFEAYGEQKPSIFISPIIKKQ